jgi:glycosyltransferase involved in cell wall biosynthesis
VTIHNSIDIDVSKDNRAFKDKFEINGKRIVLSVARLAEEKGLQILLRSVNHVVEAVPDAVFVIIGRDDGYRKQLLRLSRSLNLESKVIFTGVVEEGVLRSALSSCDVVAIPSLYEPFSTSMLEAMAYGKPIVASDAGGMPEAISNGVNGILVPSGDPKALADKINMVLSDCRLTKRIGKQAKMDVQKYSWHRIARRIIAVYRIIGH